MLYIKETDYYFYLNNSNINKLLGNSINLQKSTYWLSINTCPENAKKSTDTTIVKALIIFIFNEYVNKPFQNKVYDFIRK